MIFSLPVYTLYSCTSTAMIEREFTHFEYLGLAVIRQDSPFLLLEMNHLQLKQEKMVFCDNTMLANSSSFTWQLRSLLTYPNVKP